MSKASNNPTLTHKASTPLPVTREVVYLVREALILLVKATEVWLGMSEDKSALITKKQRRLLEKLKQAGFLQTEEAEEEPEES